MAASRVTIQPLSTSPCTDNPPYTPEDAPVLADRNVNNMYNKTQTTDKSSPTHSCSLTSALSTSNPSTFPPSLPPSPQPKNTPPSPSPASTDRWFYPPELANDLQDTPLPTPFIHETLACAWEYSRSVIPQFANWPRYLCFCRIIALGVVCEFRGGLVDIASDPPRTLGYDIEALLDGLFTGMGASVREDMGREYKAFLLVTADKAGGRRGVTSELFRRYVNALARGPKTWFRLRDCDALARFTMAAALACNDYDNFWFSELELDILTELCDAMYDAVAFHKHRCEGETNNTFAYVGEEMRVEVFKRYREVLWELDVVWAGEPARLCVLNFMRLFAGPIHLMMRRYRFVEDGLVLGRAETGEVVEQTRRNVKLWNRVGHRGMNLGEEVGGDERNGALVERISDVIGRSETIMFPGMADLRRLGDETHCGGCQPAELRDRRTGSFGGVHLCGGCRPHWQEYVTSFPERAAKVFPFMGGGLRNGVRS